MFGRLEHIGNTEMNDRVQSGPSIDTITESTKEGLYEITTSDREQMIMKALYIEVSQLHKYETAISAHMNCFVELSCKLFPIVVWLPVSGSRRPNRSPMLDSSPVESA